MNDFPIIPEIFKKQHKYDDVKLSYGTAGFRTKAENLTFIAFRLGYLVNLRARHLNKSIGIMITASHNPACDNGLKIVDPMGEMLASDWEEYATMLVNTSEEEFPATVRKLESQIVKSSDISSAKIICAIDTRSSGPSLRTAVEAGARLLDISDCHVEFVDHGVLTTPQLHYIVRCSNDPGFGICSVQGYYKKLSTAYNELLKLTPNDDSFRVLLDCANGVGAIAIRQLMGWLTGGNGIILINCGQDGELNYECGADFVKLNSILPKRLEKTNIPSSQRCASLDGDADRLVYFRRKNCESNEIVLLDGDKIAVLYARYVKEILDASGLANELTIGIVQTAYANGSSTRYIREHLNIEPACVPTGVKHLHHKATDYDIGIYFEANGHGTITFSTKFKQLIRSDTTDTNVKRLYYFSNVINEVVGDGIADLLAVELILRHYKWSIQDWEEKLYHDAPNIQIKVPVHDRSIFKTNSSETKLLEPRALQDMVDKLVKDLNGVRAFIRPSGTENVVRVYAESSTFMKTKILGEEIAKLVPMYT